MSKVTISAPGKLMLFGEHAVVYGYPCIVTAVNRYITIEVEKTKADYDILQTPGVSDKSFVRSAIELFRKKFKTEGSISLTSQSELGNYGLGSSAAVTVATIEALSRLYEVKLVPVELFKLCYQVILSVQGKASGFDVAAAIYGRTLYFDGQNKKSTLLYPKSLPIITIFSGKKGETVKMINKVEELRSKFPDRITGIFEKIRHLVEQARLALNESNWSSLGKLMNSNHQLLVELGVSNSSLNRLVMETNKAGAFGAKLSGAGGGDCVIVLYPQDKKEAIIEAIEKTGKEIINLKTGAKGIRPHPRIT